jgi:hypothetical protein
LVVRPPVEQPTFSEENQKIIEAVKALTNLFSAGVKEETIDSVSKTDYLPEARVSENPTFTQAKPDYCVILNDTDGSPIGNGFRFGEYLYSAGHVFAETALNLGRLLPREVKLPKPTRVRNDVVRYKVNFANLGTKSCGLTPGRVRLAPIEIIGASFDNDKVTWTKARGSVFKTPVPGLYEHDANTSPGMSGAVVIQNNRLIGIHVGYRAGSNRNVFVGLYPCLAGASLDLLIPRGASQYAGESAVRDENIDQEDIDVFVKRNALVRKAIENQDFNFSSDDDPLSEGFEDRLYAAREIMNSEHNISGMEMEDLFDFVRYGGSMGGRFSKYDDYYLPESNPLTREVGGAQVNLLVEDVPDVEKSSVPEVSTPEPVNGTDFRVGSKNGQPVLESATDASSEPSKLLMPTSKEANTEELLVEMEQRILQRLELVLQNTGVPVSQLKEPLKPELKLRKRSSRKKKSNSLLVTPTLQKVVQ